MDDILSAAEEILGPAVRVERHRDWAIFWCPFHSDEDRAGEGGHPNFGVHLVEGYWKCLALRRVVSGRRPRRTGQRRCQKGCMVGDYPKFRSAA
ncbi:MAG: hypothetical protein JW730_19280 [Anaerolineales bacterium]|nr:hypothetical protein [Anaerolineales bacterium]